MVWFHAAGDHRVGPLSFDDMVALLRQGRIDGETRIWNAALDGWRKLHEVEAFAAVLAEVTPPPLDPPSLDPPPLDPPSPESSRPVLAPASAHPSPSSSPSSALAVVPPVLPPAGTALPGLQAGDAGVWACLAAVLGFALAAGWQMARLVALINLDVANRQAAKAPMTAMVESLIWLQPALPLMAMLALFALGAHLSLRTMRRAAATLRREGTTPVAADHVGRAWFAVPGFLYRPPRLVRGLLDDAAGRPPGGTGGAGRAWLVRLWWLLFGLGGVLLALTLFLAIKAHLTPDTGGGWIDGKHLANGGAVMFALLTQAVLIAAALLWAVIVLKLGRVRLVLPPAGAAGGPVAAGGAAPGAATATATGSGQSARFAAIARLPRPVLLGAGALAVLLIGWLALGGGIGGPKGPPPSWKKTVVRDAVTDAQIVRLTGVPQKINGVMNRAPSFTISCGTRGVGLGVDFGIALEDAFPDGAADMVRVTVRADQGTPQVLGFLPSRDWNSAFAIDQSSLGAGLTSLAVDMMGGLMPSARGMNTRWKAIDLVRLMAGSRQFVLRAPTRTGTDITLTFEMESYNRLLAELPAQCR